MKNCNSYGPRSGARERDVVPDDHVGHYAYHYIVYSRGFGKFAGSKTVVAIDLEEVYGSIMQSLTIILVSVVIII